MSPWERLQKTRGFESISSEPLKRTNMIFSLLPPMSEDFFFPMLNTSDLTPTMSFFVINVFCKGEPVTPFGSPTRGKDLTEYKISMDDRRYDRCLLHRLLFSSSSSLRIAHSIYPQEACRRGDISRSKNR